MRIWVDLTNTAHIYVLRPLVEELERLGHDVELTARPLSQTLDALEQWGRPHTVLGRHGGASRAGKARAAAERAGAMVRFGHGRRFDGGLAHGSTDLPVACRVLGLPNATMSDYEWATTQHAVNFRLATRVLVPDAIPEARVRRYGARPPKLVRRAPSGGLSTPVTRASTTAVARSWASTSVCGQNSHRTCSGGCSIGSCGPGEQPASPVGPPAKCRPGDAVGPWDTSVAGDAAGSGRPQAVSRSTPANAASIQYARRIVPTSEALRGEALSRHRSLARVST